MQIKIASNFFIALSSDYSVVLVRTPQEGNDLAAGAGRVRREGRGRGAGGNALLHCPENCIVEVIGGLDIRKWIHHIQIYQRAIVQPHTIKAFKMALAFSEYLPK